MANARVAHYGFALAMPAAVALVVLLVAWLPAVLVRFGGSRRAFQGVVLVSLALTCAAFVDRSSRWAAGKTERVGAARDAFFADGRGRAVTPVLEHLASGAPEGATVAVLPEGAMINYLLRRRNPTPYAHLMPPEMAAFGEESVVAAYAASPPDYVVLVHKDTREYGTGLLGRGYGERLFRWVTEHYEPSLLVGRVPLRVPEEFGILVLTRRGVESPSP